MERKALVLSAFALCASALAATADTARAQTIDLSLNLRFNDPADPTEGGVWYLVANTTGGATNEGIAGVSAYLLGIDPTAFHGSTVPLPAGMNPAFGAYPVVGQADIGNVSNGGSPFNDTFDGAHNVVYGQNNSLGGPPTLVGGIGQGAGPGNVGADPLRNSAFDDYAVLLSGTFPGGATADALPRFSPNFFSQTGGNVLASTSPGIRATGASVDIANLHVRGDSLGSLNLNAEPGQGLLRGDVTRDFKVDGDDLANVLLRFGDTPPGGGFTWDQGDVTDDGLVDGDDLAEVLLRYNDLSIPPGSVAEIAAAVVPGDNNGDGDVDGNDLLSTQRGQSPGPMSAAAFNDWLANFGTGSDAVAAVSRGTTADFNLDGVVDGADLHVWRSSVAAADGDGGDILMWQRQLGQMTATPINSAIPEPQTIGLMVLGALTLMTARRRTRLQFN